MARILFVVPPLAGHVYPAVGVAGELAERGHEVAVAGHASVVRSLVPGPLRLVELPEDLTAEARAEVEEKSRRQRGTSSFKFLWEDFLLPLGAAMARDLEPIVEKWRPDVVVVDQQAVGGALLARRQGLRWVTLATTSAEFDNPYGIIAAVGQWVVDQLREFQVAAGVPAEEAARGDLRFSDQLTLVCSVTGLLRTPDAVAALPPHTEFIGSAAGLRQPPTDFPWTWLDPKRAQVLVSLGTVTREAGGRFLRVATEALAGMADRAQTIVVAPPGIVDDLAAAAPADVLVRASVPQLELMGRLAAVVCHAGNNTVCEALSQGVPLVVAPVRDDQPVISEQVTRAGAGVRVRFGRVNAAGVAAAVGSVLDDPEIRASADRLRAEFAAAGGVTAAAAHIEKLLG
ncbi:glycosyltransferase [Pseudofrankia inefficax]|uniref:Glycosyltransferase, MGT family n=1 Tax=Pseudofrankia inefficax (strain DSM 45817 / CECT 9037 / DDB 130130 / EuI1c) TaxID=298654 RepID=E3J2B8_PSEI1|nr:glycosyltransferase [Pseudofrankia inefficax]ADP79290.1 glycosyltransferase, MGT family [Pseudofrankia inefficax]